METKNWKTDGIKIFDEIGYFKGKPISKMSRGELLDFAQWSGRELSRLNKIEFDTRDYLIEKEIKNGISRKI